MPRHEGGGLLPGGSGGGAEHQCEGNARGSVWNSGVRSVSPRAKGEVGGRQPGGLELLQRDAVENGRIRGHFRSNISPLSGPRHFGGGSDLDSVEGEFGSGQNYENGGRGRLDGIAVGGRQSLREVGNPDCGQIRFAHEQGGSEIQLLASDPGLRGGGRFHASVGRRVELGGGSVQLARTYSRFCGGSGSDGVPFDPSLAGASMVALIPANGGGRVSGGKFGVHSGSLGQGRAEELRGFLEARDGEIRWKKGPARRRWSPSEASEFLRKPRLVEEEWRSNRDRLLGSLVDASLAVTSAKSYSVWWKEFEEFAAWGGWPNTEIEPPSIALVEDFFLWLSITERGSSARVVSAALKHSCLCRGLEDPMSGRRIRKIIRGVERIAAEEGEPGEKRSAFPLGALKGKVEEAERSTSPVSWIVWRDIALVALGFRAIRRPGEIAQLSCGDIAFRPNGSLEVRVGKSKTDQLRKGSVLSIEGLEGSTCCPVRLMRIWFDLVHGDSKPEDPVFFSGTSLGERRRISRSSVSTVVRKMAEKGGFSGKFSGHSLRIGGASAAVAGGMSMAQVKAIGAWKSDAVDGYLRSIEAAAQGASKKMGF